MTSREQVRLLLQRRPSAPRWPYVLPGLVAFFFVGHAFEDAGLQGAAVYLAILILSALGALWPTVLGWGLLLVPFLAFGVLVALSPQNGPIGEWIVFLLCGFVPVLALWAGRPWVRRSSSALSEKS